MKFILVQTATFSTLWKHWRLNEEDLRALELAIMQNPLGGPIMANTGGIRKMRFSPSSRHSGKSGAFRVCYFYFPKAEIVYLVLAFPKSEQPNLTNDQRKACRAIAAQIKATQN